MRSYRTLVAFQVKGLLREPLSLFFNLIFPSLLLQFMVVVSTAYMPPGTTAEVVVSFLFAGMLGLILGVHSDHKVIGVLIMFAGLVSMINFLPHYKEYKDE